MLASLSSSSTSLATVTPSLVTVGEPHDFSMTTLRPRGPSVTLTALARRLSPLAISDRAAEANTISLAAMFVLSMCLLKGGSSVEDREEVFLAHDQVLFTVDLDLGAAVLAEQHAVSCLDLGSDQLAVLVAL